MAEAADLRGQAAQAAEAILRERKKPKHEQDPEALADFRLILKSTSVTGEHRILGLFSSLLSQAFNMLDHDLQWLLVAELSSRRFLTASVVPSCCAVLVVPDCSLQ